MMLSHQALMESVFQAALRGCDLDVAARRDALWDAAVCIQADCLRTMDPYSREVWLRRLVSELRKSIAIIDELLKPRPTAPLTEIIPPEGVQ
jgi:hypothetical protein